MRKISRLAAIAVMALAIFRTDAADPAFDQMLDKLLDGTVPQVSTESLATEVDHVVLLDSRSLEEFETSHLPGARWVGYKKFEIDTVDDLDRNIPVVVYCSVGKRSEIVGEKLQKAGFKNVKNLRGGIFQWANDGRPLVDGNGPTKNVHPYDRKWGQWLAPHVPTKK
jgi:rhodanese-related sulfurtransferase